MRFIDSNTEKEIVDRRPVAILGVPFDKVTISEAVAAIEEMVASRQPHYLVTANVDFLVQAQQDGELRRILANADLSLCDGTPVVWASRLLGNPLPERVAGSDLTPLLLKVAAEKGWRVYFLGATPEALAEAVARLERDLPSLIIAGHESPPFRPLSDAENEEIAWRIQEARPDLVFVAFGCPKAEKWIARHYRAIGAPVMVGVGGTIDFLAGRVKRAPRWMARGGVEWIYRLMQEPRRLWRRYSRDLWVFSWSILAQWLTLSGRVAIELEGAVQCAGEHGVLDLSDVPHIDSGGVGLFLALQKKMRAEGRQLVLASPNRQVRRALAIMRLQDDFIIAPNLAAAHRLASPVAPIWMAKRAA